MDSRYEDIDLVNARRFNRTGFDCDPHVLGPNSKPIFVDTCFGQWLINGDGTVSDTFSGLTWTQAPWGMKWTGKAFAGIPVLISWTEATRLFGQGVTVQDNEKVAVLTDEDIKQSGIENGYIDGNCKVFFAGSSSWRLPTIAEWRTIQFFDNNTFNLKEISKETQERDFRLIFPSFNLSDRFWSSNGKGRSGESKRTTGKVSEPAYSVKLAWTMMFDNIAAVDAQLKLLVLFVRNT